MHSKTGSSAFVPDSGLGRRASIVKEMGSHSKWCKIVNNESPFNSVAVGNLNEQAAKKEEMIYRTKYNTQVTKSLARSA